MSLVKRIVAAAIAEASTEAAVERRNRPTATPEDSFRTRRERRRLRLATKEGELVWPDDDEEAQ